MKNYADLGGCYPPLSSASADKPLLDLHNSSYHTQPHPIIAIFLLLCKPLWWLKTVSLFFNTNSLMDRYYHATMDINEKVW